MGPHRPLLPVPACQKPTGGHPEAHPRREIVDGIRYLVDNGIKWRSMPADYPPWRTIYGFARRWAAAGVISIIRDQLRRKVRLASGKTPHAASAIVDAQSIKGSETVGKDTRRWGDAKKINGRKRHLICDNRGLVLLVMVTAADMSDRDAAKELLFRLALTHPEIAIVWADSAYAGMLVTWAKAYLDITIKTVRRPPDSKGFVVLPRRWVVERSWSWIMRATALPRPRTAPRDERIVDHVGGRHLDDEAPDPAHGSAAERRDVSPCYLAQAA